MTDYSSNIWKLYLFKFLISLHFFGGVLVPFFLDWGKITFFQIMLLQAIFAISILIFEIPTGAIADRWGRKNSLIIASIFLIISIFIYSYKPIFILFIIGEIFWAISNSLLSGTEEALMYDTLLELKKEKKSKKIFAKMNIYSILGIMIAAPIGSIIAKYIGLRETMIFMTIPFIFALILSFSFKEPKIGRRTEKQNYISDIKTSIKYFKDHKILRILTFDKVSIGIFAFMIVWLYQPKLIELNIDILYFGIISAIMTGTQLIMLSSFEWFEKRLKSKKSICF
jgi:predicted MFS family arabinose efflux permease